MKALTLCLALILSSSVLAEEIPPSQNRLAFSGGAGDLDFYVLGISLQRDFSRSWFVGKTGRLTGYHDLSLLGWIGDEEDVQALSYTPVFVYRFNGKNVEPYVLLGVGISYQTETEFLGKNMSTHFQFHDRVGLGIRFAGGAHDLSVQAMHYSNAGIESPNPGMDMFVVSYSFRF